MNKAYFKLKETDFIRVYEADAWTEQDIINILDTCDDDTPTVCFNSEFNSPFTTDEVMSMAEPYPEHTFKLQKLIQLYNEQ